MDSDSEAEYVELSTAVVKARQRHNPALWIPVLLIVMLLAVIVLVVVPPATSRYNEDIYPLDDKPVSQTEQPPLKSGGGAFPEVRVKRYGGIRGVYKNGVRVFHGVPFAEPPLGDLRWQPPQAKKPWHDVTLDASKRKAACLQNPSSINNEEWVSEDCLYLEIFAPIDISAGPSSLPVMFYIHGGAYSSYAARDDLFDASIFVRRTGVIVVVTEYRLGAMGFLVHGDRRDVQGNFGLLDQAFALKWVHDNIADFGGDPKKVTLAGQSAGAQSSIIHLLSKKSSKYFRSVILESPPVPLPVKTYSQGIAQTIIVAEHAHCNGDLSEGSRMKCLRNASAKVILEAQKLSTNFGEQYLDRPEPWGPVIDRKLVHKPLMKGFKDARNIHRKPILWGVTSEEALIFIRMLHIKPTGYLMYIYAKSVFQKLGVDSKQLSTLYPSEYNKKDTRTIISKMFTDFLFRCPVEWVARQLIDKHVLPPMWTYVFERTVTIPPSNPVSICSEHACHGTEIPFVFNTFTALNVDASQIDIDISKNMDYYYGNFIWYGNPNSHNMGNEESSSKKEMPYWPKSNENKDEFQNLRFQQDGSVGIGGGVRKDLCEFWYNWYDMAWDQQRK